MKIGEIVEILIRIKDNYGYSDYRREALEETCNLLDKLPRMEETKDYEPTSLSGQSMAAEGRLSRPRRWKRHIRRRWTHAASARARRTW